MHIAQFIHRYPPALGGAEAWTARLSKHLAATGHNVTVWTTTALDLTAFTKRGKSETTAGVRVEDGVLVRRYCPEFRFPCRKLLLKALSMLPARSWQAMTAPWTPISLRMWKDAGRETGPVDVVHALAFPYSSLAMCALRLARKKKVPFVLTPFLHLGDLDNPCNWIRRAYTSPHLCWLLRQADRVIVQTPTEQKAVRNIGVPDERIILQGLGVDPAECTGGNREAARSAWGIRPDEIVVGHLANLSMEKGSLDLVAATEEVQNNGPPIRVVLAGSAMPSFKKIWKHFLPRDGMVLTGPLDDQQRRDFFAGIDLFVLPSISDSFGLVFLEAWANGVAVIGYRAGGVVDVIQHEQDGLLMPCFDIDALAKAIRRLANDEPLRVSWGNAGKAKVNKEFRWEEKLAIAKRTLTGMMLPKELLEDQR